MDALPLCPRCGRDTNVEALQAPSGSRWLFCDRCRHVWRQLDQTDAFALLVATQAGSGRSSGQLLGEQPGQRAERFTLRLEVRCRPRPDGNWQVGHTENLSRSGVLFRPGTPLDQDVPLDLIIVLPGDMTGEPPSRFRCQAKIVRQQPSTRAGETPAIGVRVDGYSLTLN